MRVRQLAHRVDQRLAAAVGSRRALVQHERRVADSEPRPQRARRARRAARARSRCGPRRAAPAAAYSACIRSAIPSVTVMTAVGPRHGEPLDAAHEARPRAISVRHAGGELVRVVDQLRPRQPRAEQARQQHRRVVRVDDVRAELQRAAAGTPRGTPRGRPGTAARGGPRPAARPRRGRSRRACPRASGVELDHGDLVPRLGERPRLAAHARVVLDGLVKEHRDAHRAHSPYTRALGSRSHGGAREDHHGCLGSAPAVAERRGQNSARTPGSRHRADRPRAADPAAARA